MTSLSVRTSFRARAARIIQEFAIAVTLCVVVVLLAGGISDTSMRVAAVVAAIYLTAAETHRQMPELTRHAMAPLRRLIREDSRPYVSDQRSSPATETADLSRAIDALASATRQSFETFANIEQTMRRATDDWSASRERDQAVIEMMEAITRQSIARETLLLDAVRQLQLIAAKLESTTAPAAQPHDADNPTQVSWSRYEPRTVQLWYSALSAFEGAMRTAEGQLEVELLSKHEDTRLRNALAHNVTLQTVNIHRALSFYRELALPVVYIHEAELFRRLRSDPEALKRFIDELVARMAQIER